MILNELAVMLDIAFDSDVIVDVRTASNVPLGGDGARALVVFASSLDSQSRSSLENVLGRVLRRTAPVSGREPIVPPSHVLLISSHGTERVGRMPYSMRNLLGNGKLDGLREMEGGLIAASRGRASGGKAPLDYTIVKFGDVETRYDEVRGKDDDAIGVSIRPGDALDGGIGPMAAASVILQAMAYQPYARNATLCAEGGVSQAIAAAAADDDRQQTWNDKFLCLSGPELLRIDAGSDADFAELGQYVKLWSGTYDGGDDGRGTKGTGLTTPAIVRASRRPPSRIDGVIEREGVRILFLTTNTGDRYKSATEERVDERMRNNNGGGKVGTSGGKSSSSSSSSSAGATPIPMSKARKEGGVEVLVERTIDGNVRVRARRCNVDDRTIVKEMSEGAIVRSLKKAVEAWLGR